MLLPNSGYYVADGKITNAVYICPAGSDHYAYRIAKNYHFNKNSLTILHPFPCPYVHWLDTSAAACGQPNQQPPPGHIYFTDARVQHGPHGGHSMPDGHLLRPQPLRDSDGLGHALWVHLPTAGK